MLSLIFSNHDGSLKCLVRGPSKSEICHILLISADIPADDPHPAIHQDIKGIPILLLKSNFHFILIEQLYLRTGISILNEHNTLSENSDAIENLLRMKKIIRRTVWLERMKVNLVIFNVRFIFLLINETDTRTS